MDYARRLICEGVPTELHVYPGAYHAYDLVPEAGVTKAYFRDFIDALGRSFNGWARPNREGQGPGG